MRSTSIYLATAALLESTSAYRLFFYRGPSCTGEQLGVSAVAGPSTCNNEFAGVAESVLVKIDNANDDQYAVKFYSEASCGGQPLSEVSNNQACLVLSYIGVPSYTSYQVTGGVRKRGDSTNQVTETDFGGIHNGSFHTPLNHGIGALFEDFAYDANGTIVDEDDLINTWWGGETSSSADSVKERDLMERDLMGTCTNLVRCTGTTIANGAAIVSSAATTVYNKVSPTAGWAPFFKHPLTAAVGGSVAGAGLTLAVQSHGSKPAEAACDTEGTVRSFMRDLINNFSSTGARTGYTEECQGAVCAGVSFAVGNQGNNLRQEGCYGAYINTDPATSI